MPLSPPDGLDVVDHIQQTRDSYAQLGYDAYRWALEEEPAPFVRPTKSLSESTVALVGSGGVYEVGQVAFHHKDDTSHRRISVDADSADLRTSHFAYDMTSARVDPNVVFPLAPLRRLRDEGLIGGLAPHALAFMGGIYSQRRLREELIPALVADLEAMAPDVILLVPV
ncbi:MAG: glycine/sarcosine/betaine reductase selenoprotein B family protein [Actinomycetota bacterium]